MQAKSSLQSREQISNNSNHMLSESFNQKLKEGATENGKQKDPYYFTFFNSKNEENFPKNSEEIKEKPQEAAPKEEKTTMKTIPTKPQLKSKSKNTKNSKQQQRMRESANKSQITRLKSDEEDEIENNSLILQKYMSTSTP